eukprot:COSAG04_NODE_20477_length_392_cov_1.621160_1_plen_116_part_10
MAIYGRGSALVENRAEWPPSEVARQHNALGLNECAPDGADKEEEEECEEGKEEETINLAATAPDGARAPHLALVRPCAPRGQLLKLDRDASAQMRRCARARPSGASRRARARPPTP